MKNFITAVLVFMSLVAVSQDNQKQLALLDEVAVKIDKYSSLEIEFDMFIEDLQSKKRDQYAGSAIYKSGSYKLDIMGQIVHSDGKTSWTYLKDAEEVNITESEASDEGMMINPKTLLHDYKSKYKVMFMSDKFEKNRPLVEYDLIPVNIEDKKYSKITLKIDKAKKQIYSARYIGKDGVSFLMELRSIVENPAVPDSKIKFSESLYPEAEIIDMR